MSGRIEEKSFAFKRAAKSAYHVMLLDEQDPQAGTSEEIAANQPSNSRTDHYCVIGHTGTVPQRFERPSHTSLCYSTELALQR